MSCTTFPQAEDRVGTEISGKLRTFSAENFQNETHLPRYCAFAPEENYVNFSNVFCPKFKGV
jgi:hypothetical protein